MNSWHYTRQRSEIVLGTIRLILAAFTSAALGIDPYIARGPVVQPLAVGYFCVAIILLFLVQQPTFKQPWRVRLHLADLAFCTLFICLARSNSIVALSHVLFPLLASSLRFRWRAGLWTALPVAGTYIVVSLFGPDHIAFGTLVVQGLAILLAAVVSAILAAHHEQTRDQFAELVWGELEPVREPRAMLQKILEHAANVLQVPRVLLVWRSSDRQSWDSALLAGTHLHWNTAGELLADPIGRDLSGVDFFCRDLDRGDVILDSGELFRTTDAISPQLRSRFGVRSVIACEIAGSSVSGRVLFLDREAIDADVLVLARGVSDIVTFRLEQFDIAQQAEMASVTEERSRLARDLHDGLLQSLTGASLQLEAARRLLDSRPDEASQILRDIQDVLVVDQHEVRFFVDSLRLATRRSDVDLRSGARFAALTAIVRRQWGIDLDVRMEPLNGMVPKSRRREIHRLIREAVFNAARHAGANRIVVDGGQHGDKISVVVADDGKGFSFRGRYDLLMLNQLRCGPATLKERVESLGGELVIDSTDRGSRLEISIPTIGFGGAA